MRIECFLFYIVQNARDNNFESFFFKFIDFLIFKNNFNIQKFKRLKNFHPLQQSQSSESYKIFVFIVIDQLLYASCCYGNATTTKLAAIHRFSIFLQSKQAFKNLFSL